MEEIKKTSQEFLKSPTFHKMLMGVGITIVLLITFQAGVFVGFRKAAFSFGGGDNYYRVFGENRHGPFRGMMQEEFPTAGGSIGRVLSVQIPMMTIEDKNNIEKSIRVSNETTIRKGRETITAEKVQVNDMVVVIGAPNNNSEIDAKFIRLLPTPPEGFPLGTTSITHANTPIN